MNFTKEELRDIIMDAIIESYKLIMVNRQEGHVKYAEENGINLKKTF